MALAREGRLLDSSRPGSPCSHPPRGKLSEKDVLIKTKSNSTKQSERLTISDFVAAAFGRSGGAFRKAVHIKHKRQAFIYVTHSLLVGNVQLLARGWVASRIQKEFDVL